MGVDNPAVRSLIRETPLVTVAAVTARIGPVALKLENLQRTGSFKLRGVVRKLNAMSDEQRANGVITASAGNHGSGLALACAQLGVAATVVVPTGTPAIKLDRIRGSGAEVIIAGANYDDAEILARRRADTSSAVFITPLDDEDIIAGNGGDLARELDTQVGRVGGALAQVVCPVGGGSLIAGLAAHLGPSGVSVIGVQPARNCAMYESLVRGHAVTSYPEGEPTIAKGCEGATSERAFAIVREHVERIALVSEDAIRRAIEFCYRAAGQIVEPSGALAMAGFLDGAIRPATRGVTVCVITGGNIDPTALDEVLRTTDSAAS